MDMNLLLRSIEGCPDCRDNGGDFSQQEREGIPLCSFHTEVAEDFIKEYGENILNKLKAIRKT